MARDGQKANASERQFSRRALLVGGGQLGVFALIGAQLYRLQVVDGAGYQPLAERNRMALHPLLPERGRIVDRHGTVLASNRRTLQVLIIPALAPNLAAVVERLSSHLELTPAQHREILARARRQPGNVAIVVGSNVPFERFARINLDLPNLPGVRPETIGLRRYYHARETGHVVGHVGAVGEVALGDEPMLRDPRLRVGKTGVEHGLDGLLRGKGGAERYEVDAQGRIVRSLEVTPAAPGSDVTLSLDLGLQQRVMARLGEERAAAAAVVDIGTGEILVLGSHPTFDTNVLVGDFEQKEWQGLAAGADDPLVNRAVQGLYPPGSTFKMVTVLAALERGVVTPRRTFTCHGSYRVRGITFGCWNRSGHGAISLHRALRESCDVYHYVLARRTGIDAIAAMARRLGLGEVYSAGISGQKPGIVPDPTWKRGHQLQPWYTGDTVLTGIGQGFALSSPLQLAVMTARIASGRAVVPSLIRSGSRTTAAPFKSLGLAPQHLDIVRKAMAGVVNETGGTGHGAQLGEGLPTVAGKTGTSQVARLSRHVGNHALPWELRDHALFVSYVPAGEPRYAIAVVVEHGGSGGKVAAPLARDIMKAVLERQTGLAGPHSQSPVQGRGQT